LWQDAHLPSRSAKRPPPAVGPRRQALPINQVSRVHALGLVARLAGLLICLIAICTVDRAHAHAALVESDPADGAVLADAPARVTLRFNEVITPVLVRVLDIEARSIADTSAARVENDTLSLALPPGLPPATYVVTYRVISIDSHPVSGTIVFSVGRALPPQAERAGASREITVLAALFAVRALFLAAVLIAAGGMLALWRVAGFAADSTRLLRPVVAAAAIGGLVLAPPLLGLIGCDLAGTALAGLADAATWRVAWATPAAQGLALAVTGLVLLLIALPRLQQGGNRLVGTAASLIALASFAVSGHAATAPPQGLMRWAVPVHALCAAFWIGALPLLAAALRTARPQAAHALAVRFSNHAFVVVALILVLGTTIAVVQVEHVAMLWQTPYGIVLAGKLAAVLLLLVVAAHNRWHALPRLASGQHDAARPLRRGIAAEYLLFAAILGFTAVLSQIEPPRATVARDAQALASGQAGSRDSITQSGYRVTLSVAPARSGHNAVAVAIATADGAAVAPQEVALDLSLPTRGIADIRRNTLRDASGTYMYHGNDLALAGRWHIEVQVLVDDFTKVSARFEVEIR
jgi:copper transport protein